MITLTPKKVSMYFALKLEVPPNVTHLKINNKYLGNTKYPLLIQLPTILDKLSTQNLPYLRFLSLEISSTNQISHPLSL
jgi:hypothetical protein